MANASPLVSVIIIFLNAEKFFQEAVESVFDQTYDNWELLLVDDGSTDGSTSLALQYARKGSMKVRYLEHSGHQNRGMSASRNLGIKNAKGELVAFLDADDIWFPQKLDEQVAILSDQSDAATLYGNTLYWYSWSGKPEDEDRDFRPRLGVKSNTMFSAPTLLPLLLSGEAAVPCTSSIIVRLDALERVGGAEESFKGAYEDQALYAKLLLREATLVVDECWDCYRQHPEASSAVALNTKSEDHNRRYFLNWLQKYLRSESIDDLTVWKALQKNQWRLRHPVLARLVRGFRSLKRRVSGDPDPAVEPS